jgi:RNA-directed DNA polymerase
MKRESGLYPRIGELANLQLAFQKAARGKKQRPDYQAFAASLDSELATLRGELAREQITVGDYRYFRVFEPKERQICAAPFRERVLHHAIMNICEANLERYAIAGSYACRRGKGLHRAVAEAQAHCRRHRCYLKLDIRRFFDSIDHTIILGMLAGRFKDPPLLRLFDRILDSYHVTTGKGLPIGNLVSQHLANFYLGRFDHFVKEQLRVRSYLRYMDDFVLWADSRAELKALLAPAEVFLADQLALHLKPPQLNHCAVGLPFLGFRLYPDRIDLGALARRRFIRKLVAYERRYLYGEWTERELDAHVGPLLAFVKTADSLGFRRYVLARYGVVT